MRQIHSEKGGFAVCEYCSKEFTGSIGKVKFALKEHIQVGKDEYSIFNIPLIYSFITGHTHGHKESM